MASPIMGATGLEQLESAAAAVDIALTAEEIAQLEQPYAFRVSPTE
jgi:aryl-alcohol dehydrogenase-like predicted oxidoreductase